MAKGWQRWAHGAKRASNRGIQPSAGGQGGFPEEETIERYLPDEQGGRARKGKADSQEQGSRPGSRAGWPREGEQGQRAAWQGRVSLTLKDDKRLSLQTKVLKFKRDHEGF